MKNKHKFVCIIIFAIIATAIISSLSIPGIMRYRLYHKMISNPDLCKNLSENPFNIIFPTAINDEPFSIGYAQTYIPQNEIKSIQLKHNMLYVQCENYGIMFMPPLTNKSSKYTAVEILNGIKLEKTIKNPQQEYDWNLKTEKTLPSDDWTILMQSKDDFEKYFHLALFKTMDSARQNGIGLFQNENIKGIIHFGSEKKPTTVKAQVYSATQQITQDIFVESDNPDISANIIIDLLANYRFTINDPPQDKKLQDMIIAKFDNNTKFRLIK